MSDDLLAMAVAAFATAVAIRIPVDLIVAHGWLT